MSRTLRRAIPLALPLALVFMFLGQTTALAADVDIVNDAFQPSSVSVPLGGSVTWTKTGSHPHTTTSDGFDGTAGPSLWDSGLIPTGNTFTFTYTAAGKMNYHCSVHSFMHGSVTVPMTVFPLSGTTSTVFTVTWGSGSIPAGFNEDVGIKRPGQNGTGFRLNQTGGQISATFTPDAGPGIYQFASRLQNSTTGGVSAGTPIVSITVS